MKKELFVDMSDQWSYELFLCIFMIHWILVWVFMTFRDRPPSWIIYHSKAYLKLYRMLKKNRKKIPGRYKSSVVLLTIFMYFYDTLNISVGIYDLWK